MLEHIPELCGATLLVQPPRDLNHHPGGRSRRTEVRCKPRVLGGIPVAPTRPSRYRRVACRIRAVDRPGDDRRQRLGLPEDVSDALPGRRVLKVPTNAQPGPADSRKKRSNFSTPNIFPTGRVPGSASATGRHARA